MRAGMTKTMAVVIAVAASGCVTTSSSGSSTTAAASLDKATLVITGAHIEGSDATVVVVAGDAIAAVGGPELLAHLPNTARVVDAEGGWLLPGLHDAHLHLLGGGLGLSRVLLLGTRTMPEVSARIAAWAQANPTRPWVLGRGWPYEIVEKKADAPMWARFPTKEQLDAIVPDRPAAVRAYDGHTTWVNSAALKAAGITKDTPDPADGTIVRLANGEPSGALLEGAWDLVLKVVPKPTRDEMKAGLAAALTHLVALGVTSGDAIEAEPDEFDLLLELEREGKLPIDLNVLLPIEGDFDAYEAMRARSSARVRFVGVKAFVDGVVESKTAFMLTPYTGTHSEVGRPLMEKAVFFDLVNKAHARGFQVSIHAIGDAGVRLSLDAIEAAQRAYPDVKTRHRLEHIEVLNPNDAPRFAAQNVLASMQPYHSVPYPPDANVGAWPDNVGLERIQHAWAFRTLLDAKAPLTFGSDWPVYTASPLSGLAVATTRQDEKGFPPGGWVPAQRLTLPEAVHAYTVERGAPVGPAVDVGALQVGQQADLVVLPASVSVATPTTWFDAKARLVVVDGVVVVAP
jgi:predicted amidohydrolase YtcJ